MSKRYFLIDTGRYGGELTIGETTKEFVEYWKDREEDELTSYLFDYDEDVESPLLRSVNDDPNDDYAREWFDIDELEHLSAPYSDNTYTVAEIKLTEGVDYNNGDLMYRDIGMPYEQITEFGEEEQYDYDNQILSREAYSQGKSIPDEGDLEEGDEYVPVLMCHSSEKGTMGNVIIETDGEDFDHNLFAIATVESDHCDLIEAYFYNGKQVEPWYGDVSTTGKAFYASVGYMNLKWHDSTLYTDEEIAEAWEWCLPDNV